jgi:hypothetical protein
MKYADFKLMAGLEPNPSGKDYTLHIAAKKKNGLFTLSSDTRFHLIDGAGMQIFLGGNYAFVKYHEGTKGKKFVTIDIPGKEEHLTLPLIEDVEKFVEFVEHDYHGIKL